MTDLAAGLAFGGLLAAVGLVVLLGKRAAIESTRQRSVHLLVGYVLLVTAVAGLSRRDLWPFSAWQLMVGEAPARIGAPPNPEVLRLTAVDSAGREHLVDYRAWQPHSVEDLARWLLRDFRQLSRRDQDVVAEHLLGLANEGRARTLSGSAPGSFDRWWGRLSAPYHLLHPRRWTDVDSTPPQPFVAVRIYREHYRLDSAPAASAKELELLYSSTAPQR